MIVHERTINKTCSEKRKKVGETWNTNINFFIIIKVRYISKHKILNKINIWYDVKKGYMRC